MPAHPLSGKTALVTGASSGIGLAIARALNGAGTRVLLVSRSKACVTAAKRLNSGAFPADVSDPLAVRRLFAHVRSAWGHLDVLVNSAGVAEAAPLRTTTDQVWQRALAVNLTGTFLCCRAALDLMLPRKRGHIVNILSAASTEVFVNNAAYCASKFGALGLTRVLREEVREAGIRVTAVLPGAVDTPIWKNYWPDAPRHKMLQPDDVAHAVLAALSAPNQSVTEEIVLRPIGGRL
jgi:NAD(P)-dependent dehydrogenase (short-subunit alcohol dehydrogenase family)